MSVRRGSKNEHFTYNKHGFSLDFEMFHNPHLENPCLSLTTKKVAPVSLSNIHKISSTICEIPLPSHPTFSTLPLAATAAGCLNCNQVQTTTTKWGMIRRAVYKRQMRMVWFGMVTASTQIPKCVKLFKTQTGLHLRLAGIKKSTRMKNRIWRLTFL